MNKDIKTYSVSVLHNNGRMLTDEFNGIQASSKEEALEIVRDKLKEKSGGRILDNLYVVNET